MEPLKHDAADAAPASSLPSPDQERAMLQERVVELERLALVGQLTAGILHEIKNPLSFVNNYARLTNELSVELEELMAKPDNPLDIEEVTSLLQMIRNNITRIRENGARAERIILGSLAQTRSDAQGFEPTDLNALLEEFTKLAYQGVRAADKEFVVSLLFHLDAAIGKISIAPYEFNRVILNLVLNACYAVNERRKREGDQYKPTITVTSKKLADQIEIKICDNGDGIPEEVKRKLFTPFFTTKPAGKGTGLGLSLSREIVSKLHKGSMSVESEPGRFTEFQINLPNN
ncbi:sensor histidine kinase [Spirosoma gilvum]